MAAREKRRRETGCFFSRTASERIQGASCLPSDPAPNPPSTPQRRLRWRCSASGGGASPPRRPGPSTALGYPQKNSRPSLGPACCTRASAQASGTTSRSSRRPGGARTASRTSGAPVYSGVLWSAPVCSDVLWCALVLQCSTTTMVCCVSVRFAHVPLSAPARLLQSWSRQTTLRPKVM